jgi:hypothetical protein
VSCICDFGICISERQVGALMQCTGRCRPATAWRCKKRNLIRADALIASHDVCNNNHICAERRTPLCAADIKNDKTPSKVEPPPDLMASFQAHLP